MITAIQESVDIEDLVDDFVTYYIAGKCMRCHYNYSDNNVYY